MSKMHILVTNFQNSPSLSTFDFVDRK